MSVRTLTVVSAGLSQPSSSRMLADRLAEATVGALDKSGIATTVTTIELRDYAHAITDSLITGFAGESLAAAVDSVISADGLIVVTPIFTASYSGLFKSFVDILGNKELANLPVLIGATGGTPRHSLAIDYAIRPLFTYLHATPVSTGVYAASADWGATDDDGKSLPDRIHRAAGELATMMAGPRRMLPDPWALTESFDSLLENVKL